MKKMLLTKEEAMLEKELANNEWVTIPDMAGEIEKYQTHARAAMNKNKKINIRMSDWDYNHIKLKAAQEGMPYQTLVSSLIHKYLTGQLKAS